jgi:hypothetical protein
MALIEYRIIVDQNGNATVLQDVKVIGPDDRIQFVANNSNTSIEFVSVSPFSGLGPGATALVPQIGTAGPTALQVTNVPGGQPIAVPQPLQVVNTNNSPSVPFRFSPLFQENRRTFHFQCGQVTGKIFTPWGGQGGNTSDGGSN